MLTRLFNFIAYCPLPLLHALGSVLGWAAYLADRRYRHRLRQHLAASGVVSAADFDTTLRQAIGQQGQALTELLYAWGRPASAIAARITRCEGWQHAEAAIAAKRPIIFVTPHLGSADIAGRYISTRLPYPLTALYRPPKIAALEPWMQAGRMRDNGRTAPANASGVRILLKALRAGEATILLPDQAPSAGEGVWAPFFGRPAYTMTLLGRLAQVNAAVVLFFFAERQARGRFHIHIQPMRGAFSGDKLADASILNANLEDLIRMAPAQYLWSYNRYKQPAGAPAAEATA